MDFAVSNQIWQNGFNPKLGFHEKQDVGVWSMQNHENGGVGGLSSHYIRHAIGVPLPLPPPTPQATEP